MKLSDFPQGDERILALILWHKQNSEGRVFSMRYKTDWNHWEVQVGNYLSYNPTLLGALEVSFTTLTK